MTLGLSKTDKFGPSQTRSSAYRKPQRSGTPQKSAVNRLPSNNANRKESSGFLLTALAPVGNCAALPTLPDSQYAARRQLTEGRS